MSDTIDYRGLLLSFIATLTTAEDLSDVRKDMVEVLKKMELPINPESMTELDKFLTENNIQDFYA